MQEYDLHCKRSQPLIGEGNWIPNKDLLNCSGIIPKSTIDFVDIRRYEIIPEDIVSELPRDAIAIDVSWTPKWRQIKIPKTSIVTKEDDTDSCGSISQLSVNSISNSTWNEWLECQDNWVQQIMSRTIFEPEHQTISLQDLMNNKVQMIMATDGGKKDDSGMFAAIFAMGRTVIAKTYGKTPDAPEIHSSYRSETYGLLAGITLLVGIIQRRNLKFEGQLSVEIHCDNKSLVDNINRHQKHQMTLKDY